LDHLSKSLAKEDAIGIEIVDSGSQEE